MRKILLLLVFFTPFFVQAQIVTDDFESYNAGSFDGQFNPVQWTGWFGGNSNASVSTDYSFSGSNSLKVWDDIAKESDIVALLGTLYQGVDTVSFMQYIPSTGSGAYYNLQHNYTNTAGDWAAEVYFGTNPDTAYIQTDGVQYGFSPTMDVWVEQKFVFDFTNTTAQFYYGGVLTHTWALNTNAAGGAGLNTINAINLYAHDNGTGANSLAYYDDMPVFAPPTYDVELIPSSFPAVYTQLTAEHVQPLDMNCDVTNIGGLDVTNVSVTFDIVDGNGTNVFTETVTQASLAVGVSASFATTNTFTPTMSGDYTFYYSVSTTEIDANMPNNADTLGFIFTITDSTLAKDDGNALGSIGVSSTGAGIMGHVYDFQTADSISSVSVSFIQTNAAAIGEQLTVHVFDMMNGMPTGTPIASSMPYTIDTSSALTEHIFNFSSPVSVDSGAYLIALEEQTNTAQVAYSGSIFTPNTGFFTVDNGATWTSFVSVNIPITLFIRPNVTGVTPNVSTFDVKPFEGTFEVMPNPTAGLTTLNIELDRPTDVNISVFDITGKTLQTFTYQNVANTQHSLDLSEYVNGVYLVRLMTNDGQMITKRIVKR